ncbi:MAG: hypothetical protein HYU28_03080 [Actinobacteria bacterium]|nr:hypothetical protein [Actinomycetota bacterium]
MSVLAFASCKASPGVTTTVVALAAAWPGEAQALLIEADPCGGVLAPRFGLSTEPGLVSAAAAAFRGARGSDLLAHAQEFADGVWALPGPASSEHAMGALEFSDALASSVREIDGADVLIDVGRLDPRSPARPLVLAADVVTFLCRPQLDEIHHLAHAARWFSGSQPPVALLLLGHRPYSPSEVAEAVDLPLAGALPVDPAAAGALCGGSTSFRSLRRSALVRAAGEVAETLLGFARGADAPATSSGNQA